MAAQQEGPSTIRLPWYGHDMQRAHHPFGLTTTSVGAQQFVNCFPVVHKNPIQPDAGAMEIISRPPFKAIETDVDLTGVVADPDRVVPYDMISMSQLDDVLVIAYRDRSNDKLYIVQYRPWANTCLKIGEVSGFSSSSHQVSLTEIEVSNVPGIAVSIYSKDGGSSITTSGWYALTTSGLFTASSLTEITDTDFPPKQVPARAITGAFVQMDGYTFIMTQDGSIYNSDLNSITSWNTSGYVEAASKPDLGRTLVRYKHHIVAFGESSIEFYNDAGIAPPASPLERTNQAFINFGVIGPKAVINIDDTLYWISASSYGTIGLWKLEGYTPVRLSDNTFNMLADYLGGEYNLQSCVLGGLRHLILNTWNTNALGWISDPNEPSAIPPDNSTLWGTPVYCIDTKAWWWWSYEFGLSDVLVAGTGFSPSWILFAKGRHATLAGTQFKMMAATFLNGTTINNYGAHVSYIRAPNEALGSSLQYESTRDGNATTLLYWRVPVQIVTNVQDFETNNRKRISRAKIIAKDMRANIVNGTGEPFTSFASEGHTYRFGWTNYNQALYYNSTYPMTSPDLWHVYYKSLPVDIVTGTTGLTAIDTETSSRYYHNNLGTAREWQFVFNCNTFVPLTLESLELTIHMGTH